MNEALIKTVNFVIALLITMTALAYTFWSMTEWSDPYEILPTGNTVFIEDTKIPQEILWTGDQVVTKLYRLTEEDVPIIVNGRLYQSEIDVKNYQTSINLNAKYQKSVEWNQDGKMANIIFTQH